MVGKTMIACGFGAIAAITTARAECPKATAEASPVPGHAASNLPAGKKFKLVWHDEFDGTALDTTKWCYRTNFWGRPAPWYAAPSANARGILCLTFDDSHFDDWEEVMPLFEKYNARATFFARGELTPRYVAGMRRLSEAGHSIGLHGRLQVRAPV